MKATSCRFDSDYRYSNYFFRNFKITECYYVIIASFKQNLIS
ncbi:hypothetical protein [Borreliella garinii]|nr:hypothetical protein [Borreliella garinii]